MHKEKAGDDAKYCLQVFSILDFCFAHHLGKKSEFLILKCQEFESELS